MAWKSSSRNLLFLLTLFAASSPLALAVDSDFTDLYPDTAIPCLDEASTKSNCNGAPTNKALNECLCSNGGDFVTNTAKCLGEEASSQVKNVYSVMSDACLNTETPLVISQSDFYAIADGDQPTSTSASTTSTSTSTSTTSSSEPTKTNDNKDEDNNSNESNGLTTGSIVGIAVGGVVAIVGVIAIIFFLRRRRRISEESHPMLPTSDYHNGNPYHGATTFPPTEPSPGLTSNFDQDPKHGRWSGVSALSPNAAGGYSPAMTNNTASPPPSGHVVSSWGSAPQEWNGGQYAGAYATPPQQQQSGVAELPPQPAMPVYEMDGGQQPAGQGYAELSGSTPQQYQPYDAHRR